ncbi:hypothetical protein GMMP13_380056 [Candidatus Magnetomoraceae bacterium gMMP-13]
MENNLQRTLSKSALKNLNKLIKYLKQKFYVFMIGPNGMGKTRIMRAAKLKIEEQLGFKCYYFNLEEENQRGAHFFYSNILEKISDGMQIELGSDLSNDFIAQLDSCVSNPTVFLFDSFRAVSKDFYDNFSRDCRKIFNEGRANPDSGLSKILMIFAGSMVASKSEQHDTSPLWNITKQIEILPISEDETKEIIVERFKKKLNYESNDNIVKIIYDFTKGHLFLANAFIRYATKNYQNIKFYNQHLLNDFIGHIWTVARNPMNRSGDKQSDNKLYKHFISIIEYLETSPEIFDMILKILDGKFPQGSPRPIVDSITITGTISKDKGYYDFSNPVYKEFFKRLLNGYRLADFCLFHSHEQDWWEKAKTFYQNLNEKGQRRNLNESFFPRTKYFNELIPKLIHILRSCFDSIQAIHEMEVMLSLVFDIPEWCIYRVKIIENKRRLEELDPYFKEYSPKDGWVNEKELPFIEKALNRHVPMSDWTGKWLAVPVIIREDFGRLFLLKMEPNRKKWYQTVISFVQQALPVYFSFKSRESVTKELNNINKMSYKLKNALLNTEDYMYIVDREKKLIVANQKLYDLTGLNLQPHEIEGKICFDFLMKRKEASKNCLLNKAFKSKETVRTVRNIKISDKNLVMDTAFVPLRSESENQVIAVAVFMHDMSDRHLLWESFEEMQKNDTIEGMYKFILNTFKSFGFKRVFRYRPDPGKEGHFISEDFVGQIDDQDKGKKFKNGVQLFQTNDEDLLENRILVWHRKSIKEDIHLKVFFEDRFRNSDFKFKEDETWLKHDSNHPRPNFWVTVPIWSRDGMIKLYTMDNWFDNERNKEMISLDKLQALETFARAAGQILENARQREYLKKFQAMLTHGTIMPLQIARLSVDRITDLDNHSEIEKWADKTDKAIDFAQSSLASLLTIKRGSGRIQKEQVNVSELLIEQVDLFKIYTDKPIGIDFKLEIPDDSIYSLTDKSVLLQILNNLVGNSIRHLQRLTLSGNKKTIAISLEIQNKKMIIKISDNGNGLPETFISYFKKPFKAGMEHPLEGGLGIGFSREMADMLGGSLELVESGKNGTNFKLILNFGGI